MANSFYQAELENNGLHSSTVSHHKAPNNGSSAKRTYPRVSQHTHTYKTKTCTEQYVPDFISTDWNKPKQTLLLTAPSQNLPTLGSSAPSCYLFIVKVIFIFILFKLLIVEVHTEDVLCLLQSPATEKELKKNKIYFSAHQCYTS